MIKVELRQDSGSYTPVTFTFPYVDDAIYFIQKIEPFMNAGMYLTMIVEKEKDNENEPV